MTPKPGLDGRRIILVEDDFLIQMDLSMTLESAGAEVVAAGTLKDGLALADGDYDAAVLDIRLPDGEVFPIAERLHARKLPIVFHSGNVEGAGLEQRFPNAIALSKPVQEKLLLDALQRGLEMAG